MSESITLQQARIKELKDALDDAGIEHYEYSGRGMFGAHCIAANTSDDQTREAIVIAVHKVVGGLQFSEDSMGKGSVLYWRWAETKPARI